MSRYYRSLISHLQYVRDTVTSQIIAGPVKTNEHKHDEHENIEKKVDVFHILNGILAKTRNLIFPYEEKTQFGFLQSRSQSFVFLDQRSENASSGSNHYERTKEITEFWLSGSLRICIYGACLKWLLPELAFSDRWSRGTKLWERDWVFSSINQMLRKDSPARQLYLGEFNFLKCTTLLIPVPI